MSGRKTCLLTTGLLISLLGTTVLAADEGSLVFEADGKKQEAPILAGLVHIEVRGMVARARLTQVFENPSDDVIEALYLRDTALETELQISTSEHEKESGVRRLWARRKVDALMSAQSRGVPLEEVRREVVDLALEHQLVTDFTSLVAVDDLVTAQPGVLHVPGAPGFLDATTVDSISVGGFQTVEELIVCTAQAPMLDSNRMVTATSFSEVERMPMPREPLLLMNRVSGVVAISGGPSTTTFLAPGSDPRQNAVALDGIVLEGLNAGVELHPDQLEEIAINTGASDADRPVPGATLNLTTRSGTNAWRGDVHALEQARGFISEIIEQDQQTQDQQTQDQQTKENDHGGDLGGPIVRDAFWALTSLGERHEEGQTLDGDRWSRSHEDVMLRLDTMPGARLTFRLLWNNHDEEATGLEAGPRRSEEATLNANARRETTLFHFDSVINTHLYAGVRGARHQAHEQSLSNGNGTSFWNANGVLTGSGRGHLGGHEERQGTVFGTFYANIGDSFHEMDFGGTIRRLDDTLTPQWFQEPGLLIDGRNLGLDGTLLWRERGGTATAERRSTAAWYQNSVSWDRLTLFAGMRFEDDSGQANSGQGADSRIDRQHWLPRIGFAFVFGDDERALLKASLGRFADRLTHDVLMTAAPALGHALFDMNGSLLASDGWARPNRLQENMRAAVTDELRVTLEREFYDHDLMIGADVRTRRRSHLMEERRIDSDTHLLVAGDREIRSESITLRARKRLNWNGFEWMGRTWVHWSDSQWDLGPEFLAHADPNNLLGSGDDDGAPFITLPSGPFGVELGSEGFAENGVSAGLEGLVRILPDSRWGFNVAIAARFQEGQPLLFYRHEVGSDGIWRRLQDGDVDAQQLDDVVTADLRLQKEIRWDDFRLAFSLDALNVTGDATVLGRETSLNAPALGQALSTTTGRTLRFGVRLAWN